MAYNCRDGWPTIAEMVGLQLPKYTGKIAGKFLTTVEAKNISIEYARIRSSYNDYKAYLRKLGISYIVTDKDKLDVRLVYLVNN